MKVFDSKGGQVTFNLVTEIFVASTLGASVRDNIIDTDLLSMYHSQGFPNQYVGARIPSSISKLQLYTRPDAWSYRWVNANITVVTTTFNSSTFILYDILDKMFALLYNTYGLYNVSTTNQPSGIVANYTNPTSTFVSSYFLTGPAFYRNGTSSSAQLYYVENGYIKPCSGVQYALRGMGRIVFIPSYLNPFPVGPTLAITPQTTPLVFLWMVVKMYHINP
jgi:hypothetical protein